MHCGTPYYYLDLTTVRIAKVELHMQCHQEDSNQASMHEVGI